MMLDSKDISRLLSVSEKTLYRWIARKEIPAYKIGQTYRFNRVEIMEWATAKRIPFSNELIENPADDEGIDVNLYTCIKTGGIHYRISGTSQATVIESLVSVINLPEDVDRKQLAQALIAREHLGSTAIGNGIAIPHVRNPVIFHIVRPIVALCFLDNPVDFGALDRQPVTTVFTIITNTVRSHLQILSRLSYALQSAVIKPVLNSTSGREELFSAFGQFESDLRARDES